MTNGSATSRTTRIVIHALVACGGVAALSWEVLWQLNASLALGVSARGTAITLAATMAGIALGSLMAGRVLRRWEAQPPLRVYGVLESVIGVSGLLMLPGFGLLESLDSRLFGVSPAFAPVVHAAGIALLLGPPTLAMGATVPVFARIARSHGTSLAGLYGMNTIGAAGGVLLIAFALIPAFGVSNTCFVVAGVNLAVGVGTWMLPAAAPVRAGAEAAVPESPGAAPGLSGGASGACAPSFPVARLIVFTTGFVTFGLEVAWFRSLRAAFHSITDSFAIMLVAVLVPLGVGARLVPRLRLTRLSPAMLLACAAFVMLLVTPLVERMDLISNYWGDFDLEGYVTVLLKRLTLCLAILGPTMLLLGMVLPWLLEEFSDPARTGRLYGINTAGSVLGSLLAAWFLLPTLGFARTAWLLGGAVLLLAIALQAGKLRWLVAAAGAICVAVAITQTSSPGRDRVPGTQTDVPLQIVAYDEGPDGTTSVVARPSGARALVIDGFVATQEGTLGTRYMDLMGRLPMLLHPDPERALVICFGTGQTANAVREEGPGALDIVDVNPAVLRMAPLFTSNRGVLEDERVDAVLMDGRAWLRRTDRRYDVMTLEPMPPFFAGVNSLYSQDFYEIMAAKLKPGGVVCQWLPIHLVPPFHSASVAATFQSVFPDAVLWMDQEGTGILIGRRAGGARPLASDWPGLERVVARRPIAEEDVRKGVVLGPQELRFYGSLGTLITDDNQALAYGSLRKQLSDYGRQTLEANGRLIQEIALGGRPARIPPPPARIPPPPARIPPP